MSWGLGRNVHFRLSDKYAKNSSMTRRQKEDLQETSGEVDTKAVDIFQPASSLSGGNQQKVVVAKLLARR